MSAPFPTLDDHNAIRGLILAQLAAFAADDAERAFSFASEAIREMFGSSAAFVDMVRGYYPDVYRSQGATFGSLRGLGDPHAVQVARLIGDGGRVTVVCYELIHEAGRWRISGCLQGLWLNDPE